MDDSQDSDYDMEDYDDESGEDQGSLYAPTEATSELGYTSGEELNKDTALIGPSLRDPCKFLLLLPRELRDKVRAIVASICIRVYLQTIRLRC